MSSNADMKLTLAIFYMFYAGILQIGTLTLLHMAAMLYSARINVLACRLSVGLLSPVDTETPDESSRKQDQVESFTADIRE
jgi:hypothetical protein